MKTPAPAFLVMCLAVTIPGKGAAQAEAHAPMALGIAWFARVGDSTLDPLLDSLAATLTVPALDGVARRWDPRLGVVPPPLGGLRLGFLELRRGQLEGSRDGFDRAREAFSRAAAEAPDNPVSWYGLALADLELRRRDYPEPSVTHGYMSSYTAYYLGARRALQRSLQADAAFGPSLRVLEVLAVMEGDRTQPKFVTAALERAVVRDPRDVAAWLVLGRQRQIHGDSVGALRAFRNYRDRGGDPGVAGLELARSLAAVHEWDAAVQSYRSGARAGSDEGRRAYREDLAWVATGAELAAFDALPADSVADWIARFWSVRDLESVRPAGTRLREHLRRWNVVDREFRVADPERRAALNPRLHLSPGVCTPRELQLDDVHFVNPARPVDLRGWEPFLDERAVLYMRHGEPMRRAWSHIAYRRSFDGSVSNRNSISDVVPLSRWMGPGALGGEALPTTIVSDSTTAIETWVYWIDGQPRMYFLAPSVAFGPGPTTIYTDPPSSALLLAAQAFLPAGPQGGDLRHDFAKIRHDALAREAGMPRALPSARCYSFYQRVRQWSEQNITTAVRTDGNALFFPRNLEPTVQVMGMPGRPGSSKGTVLVAYAIPVERLELPDGADAVTLRFRVAGIRTGARDGFWVDTTRTLALRARATKKSYLTGLFALPVPPASYEVRVAVQLADSSAGNAIVLPGTTTTWVPDDSLRLSDIVPGGGRDNLYWPSLGDGVSINPLSAYQPRDTVELYYVEGGLRPGATYRTEIVLTKADGGDEVQSFAFEEVAARPLEAKRRGLALADLHRGTYDLTLTLKSLSTGARLSRTRRITIVK